MRYCAKQLSALIYIYFFMLKPELGTGPTWNCFLVYATVDQSWIGSLWVEVSLHNHVGPQGPEVDTGEIIYRFLASEWERALRSKFTLHYCLKHNLAFVGIWGPGSATDLLACKVWEWLCIRYLNKKSCWFCRIWDQSQWYDSALVFHEWLPYMTVLSRITPHLSPKSSWETPCIYCNSLTGCNQEHRNFLKADSHAAPNSKKGHLLPHWVFPSSN